MAKISFRSSFCDLLMSTAFNDSRQLRFRVKFIDPTGKRDSLLFGICRLRAAYPSQLKLVSAIGQ